MDKLDYTWIFLDNLLPMFSLCSKSIQEPSWMLIFQQVSKILLLQVIKSARVMKKAVAHLIPFMEVEPSHLLSTYLLLSK